MKFLTLALNAILVSYSSIDASNLEHDNKHPSVRRGLMTGGKKSQNCKGKDDRLVLKITNLTRGQPFSPFFYMIHNKLAPPLFDYNEKASPELAILAEEGNPVPLRDLYDKEKGVLVSRSTQGPLPPRMGDDSTLYIDIDDLNEDYPYVSIASMFVHSNDGICAINGRMVKEGSYFYLPGIDVGSEVNDEKCKNMPGPACDKFSTENGKVAEHGVVHIHPGFFGLAELNAPGYDWRNPMLKVEVQCMEAEYMFEEMMKKYDDEDDYEDLPGACRIGGPTHPNTGRNDYDYKVREYGRDDCWEACYRDDSCYGVEYAGKDHCELWYTQPTHADKYAPLQGVVCRKKLN